MPTPATPFVPLTEVQINALPLPQQVEYYKAERVHLTQIRASRKTLKVSEKGAVSLYGLGRFPFTAYVEQWEEMLDMAAEIRAFIEANRSKLKTRADKAVAKATEQAGTDA